MRVLALIIVASCAAAVAGCGQDRPAGTSPPPRATHALWCPDTSSPVAAKRAGARLNTAELVGLVQTDAQARAAQAGCTLRVVSIDGEALPVTDDYSAQRINVDMVDGRVAAIRSIA